jgi:PAS domain-containing protein
MSKGITAPFGERRREGRRAGQLKSRGLVVDLGPQQRAHQAVRAFEQLSRVVVEGLEEGVVITDGDLRAASWNASALRILGLTAEELAGRMPPFGAEVCTTTVDGEQLAAGQTLEAIAHRDRLSVRGTTQRHLRGGGGVP